MNVMRLAAILSTMALCATPVTAQVFSLEDDRGIPTIAPVVRSVTAAVVNISVISERTYEANPLFNDPFFREFFDFPEFSEPQQHLSAGSGVIVDAEKGFVLTNTHVLEDATAISVLLTDGRRLQAEIIGTDAGTDIALLQIEPAGLSAMEFGDSDMLLVGDLVIAVGNPFGIGQTVTSGIISALGRSGINPEGYEDFIQTDASINPGNSGGALVTLDGKLVGINTAIIAPTGGNVGIGFAVPINMATAVVAQLVEFGQVRRGRLGVMIQDLTPELAEALGIEASTGTIISHVESGTAAERAGLKPGDVITAVNGERMETSSDLRNRIGLAPLGVALVLTVLRDGEELQITANVQAQDDGIPQDARATENEDLSGADLAALTDGMPGYGEVEGVAVVSVTSGSPAYSAGLRAGDVIMAVRNEPVRSVDQLLAEVAKSSGDPTALTVYRNGGALYLILR